MAYSTAEARRELLDGFAEAIEHLGRVLGALGEAYEQLDEQTAGRLEEELFGPAQRAYGRGKSPYAGFAERHALPQATFAAPGGGLPSTGARGFIDDAVEAAATADAALAELQDSPSWAEV